LEDGDVTELKEYTPEENKELLAKFARTLNEVPTKFARALAAVRDAKAA